jgi:lysophospholipase L1-like esterase
MNWETIICLGDSITIGARSYLGYPEYMGNLLENATGSRWNMVNHATCGHKVIDLHRSITANFQNLQNFQGSLATILIGTNDLKEPTSLENFRIAYRQVILKTKLMVGHNNIILIKIPKLPSIVKYPYKFDMNQKIDEFNAVIEDLGKNHRLQVAEIKLKEEDLFDGVHLNEQGAKAFAEQLGKFILQDKGVIKRENTAIKQQSAIPAA